MGVKISELTSMGALAGTEKIPGVDSGTQYTTPTDIATYVRTAYITSPVAYTPTFTGFGTVTSITAYSWRVGSELFFEVTGTAGTPTATEARISLGYNGTNNAVTTVSTYPTLQVVGVGQLSANTSTISVMAEASKQYLVLGISNDSGGGYPGLVKRNGSDIISVGGTISIKGSVRVDGW